MATFQSTPSGGKATGNDHNREYDKERFNPRLPGGRRHGCGCARYHTRRFNPRLPGGRRRRASMRMCLLSMFQSTPSGGKATPRNPRTQTSQHVSIHAFRGEGDPARQSACTRAPCFNPRLPGGRRQPASEELAQLERFQSTPSGGKATQPEGWASCCTGVSIHAFRGEGDTSPAERLYTRTVFQSTPSGGKATRSGARTGNTQPVSIHAFRGEGDKHRSNSRNDRPAVSIHAFRGEGDAQAVPAPQTLAVSIHAFRGEGDRNAMRLRNRLDVSIHAFRGEGDWVSGPQAHYVARFNPRLPGGRRL